MLVNLKRVTHIQIISHPHLPYQGFFTRGISGPHLAKTDHPHHDTHFWNIACHPPPEICPQIKKKKQKNIALHQFRQHLDLNVVLYYVINFIHYATYWVSSVTRFAHSLMASTSPFTFMSVYLYFCISQLFYVR